MFKVVGPELTELNPKPEGPNPKPFCAGFCSLDLLDSEHRPPRPSCFAFLGFKRYQTQQLTEDSLLDEVTAEAKSLKTLSSRYGFLVHPSHASLFTYPLLRRRPLRPMECGEERMLCLQCYQENPTNPLACSAVVDKFELCASQIARNRLGEEPGVRSQE